jgi:hypothetical protein
MEEQCNYKYSYFKTFMSHRTVYSEFTTIFIRVGPMDGHFSVQSPDGRTDIFQKCLPIIKTDIIFWQF